MAQQHIDPGSFPNDPSADSIRAAFLKIQDNFTELYNTTLNTGVQSITAGAGLGATRSTGQVVLVANIPNITIQTSDSLLVGVGVANNNKATVASYSTPFKLDLAPTITTSNGRFTNTVTASTISVTNGISSNLIPTADVTYNLGSPSKRWKTLYIAAQTIDLGGATIGSDIGGNISMSKLNVASSIVSASVNSASVSSPTINVGSAQLTSSGNTLQVTNMTVVNQFSTNNVTVNNNLNVTNNITVYNIVSSNANIGGTIIDNTGTITIKQSPISTLSASSANGISTLTFADQGYAPFTSGQTITVIGVIPTGFNGTKTVTSANNTAVTFPGSTAGPQVSSGSITSGGTIVLGGANGAIQVGNTSIDQSGALSVGNTTITPEGAITTAPGAPTPDFHAPGDDSQLLFNSGGNTSAISTVTYNAGTNLLSIAGNISSGNLVSTGIVSSTINTTGTANVASLVSRGSASITGTATVGSLVTSGSLSAGAATVSSLSTSGSITAGATTVSTLSTTGAANIVGTATVGALTTTGTLSAGAATVASLSTSGTLSAGAATVASLSTSGAASVGSLSTSGAASVGSLSTSGAASVGSLSTSGTLTAGSTTVDSITSQGNASVVGSHYVSSNSTTAGDHAIGTVISITNIAAGTPAAGSIRVSYVNQGYIPFAVNQTVTITGVTTTTAYNTTYVVTSATATSVVLASTQTGTAVVTNAKISGGGNLTMTGTHTAGSLTSLGNATIAATANVGNLVSQGAAVVAGTANVGNLVTPGNSTVAGVHYIGASGTSVGSNVLVANGNAYTTGTHFMARANITNGYTSGYHVIGTGDQVGSNLLTITGNSYTSGTHYAVNTNVSTNHIVGGNIVIGGTGVVQSGNSLTVTGNSYISASHTVGGNATTTGRHTISGTGVTGNVLVVAGHANTSGTHTMGNSVTTGAHVINGTGISGQVLVVKGDANTTGTHTMANSISTASHYVGLSGAVPPVSAGISPVFTANGDAYTAGTHYIGVANLNTAIFNSGVVGGGLPDPSSVFTARGNVFVTGVHYANSNSVTIGSHVVGGSSPQPANTLTVTGNSFTSTNHFVGGNSTTLGTHSMDRGISTTSHYIGSASLLSGNIFGVSGNSYTTGIHTMTTGISATSHYIGSGSLTGSNVFGANGNAYVTGTHVMGNSTTVGSHTINGTGISGNVLSVTGNSITVQTHYMGYGVTTGTHTIGGVGTTGNALIVSGNSNVSGSHYVTGQTTISGTGVTGNALSVTGNVYNSGNHITGNNHLVQNFFTTGTLTPSTINDGSGSGTYHMTINGNGYVKDSHYVGGYSVIGGGTRKGSNILSIAGSAYTSGTHTIETSISNVSHYVGPSGASFPTNTISMVNGNSYVVNNHTIGGNSVTTGSYHLIGQAGTAVATGTVLHAVGNANTTGTHYMGNSNTIGSHTVNGTGISGNVLTVLGQSYASSHIVGGYTVIGGTAQTAGNSLTVTGNSYTSSNHYVGGNSTTSGLHAISTNPYAYPSPIIAGQITSASWSSTAGGLVTLGYSQSATPFTAGQKIIVGGLTTSSAININGLFTVYGTPSATQVQYQFQAADPGTITFSSGYVNHQSSLSVQGIITVQGNANIGNITAVNSITGQVVTLAGDTNGSALVAAGLVNVGGNHKISGTHVVGTTALQLKGIISYGFLSGYGITMSFSPMAAPPFVPGQIINLVNGGGGWTISGGDGSLLTNTDYVVTGCTAGSGSIDGRVTFGSTGTNKVGSSTNPLQPTISAYGYIQLSPSNPSMSVAGGANISGNITIGTAMTITKDGNITATGGTFNAGAFIGNGASLTSLDYNKITTNKPTIANVSNSSWDAAVAGGSFTYDTVTGFKFKPALTYTVGQVGNVVSGSNGNISINATGTVQFTPPDLSWTNIQSKPTTFTPPDATASVKGGVIVGAGLAVSSATISANVQIISGTANQVSATNNSGVWTLSTPQDISTTSTPTFGKIQLGTTTTSANLLTNFGGSLLNGAVYVGPSAGSYTTTQLTVYGTIVGYDNIIAYSTSDIRFKENVRPIPNALTKVLNIGGKLFDWKDSYLSEVGGQDEYFRRKQDFGVIANDVLEHFPEAVRTKPDGTLAVDYEKLAALSFQAIVEQEEKHKQDIKSLQDQIDTIMNLLKDKQ